MALPLDLAIVAEALFSGIESPVGFAGPDAPGPDYPHRGVMEGDREQELQTDFEAISEKHPMPKGYEFEWERPGYKWPQEMVEAYGAEEEPARGRGGEPTGGMPPMPTLPEAPSDFPLLRRAQRENWQMAMKLADLYNKYAEKEAAQRRGERTQIRQRLFGALRQASSDYAAARDSLGQTLASQTERGLSPLDLGAPAGRS